MKVSDSLDNVPNENVVTTGDQQTDQLLELREWIFATKNQWAVRLSPLVMKISYCLNMAMGIYKTKFQEKMTSF